MQVYTMRRCLALTLLLAAASGLQHSAVLDPDGDLVIHWTPEEDSNSIVIRVEARTRGWAAVGFSPNGAMTGADIVMGWVDGTAHAQDMHAVGNSAPLLDDSDDVELLEGSENSTHTVFTFRRPLRSCDTEHDLSLGMDTTRLIWALHESDPTPGRGPSYHGTRRGVRSVSLDGSGVFRFPAPGESESFVFGNSEVALPEAVTYYHCSLKKLPDLRDKVHYTGYRVKLDPATAPYVHHFVLYSCTIPAHMHDQFDEYARSHPGSECYSKNMPPRWSFCESVGVAWAVGGEGDMLPDHVGMPLGHEHGGSTYFMLESHFDNPHKHTGLKDSSGIEMFFTRSLRPVEAGILSVGHSVTSTQLIPPGQKNFITASVCAGTCTEKHLPIEGVQIHSVLLHAHLAGRTLNLRHVRNGRELPSVAHDWTYDFNFQQSRIMSQKVRILPGDTLLLDCGYNTEDRTNVTMGGFATRNEMCLAFLTYYPRTHLHGCGSYPHVGHYLKDLGVRAVEVTGLELPPVSGGDVWTVGGFKYKADGANQLMALKNETEDEENIGSATNASAEGSRDDWFNKAQLSTMKVSVEGSPTVTLYEYLTQMSWGQPAVDALQAQVNGGQVFHRCQNDKLVLQSDYREEHAGPFSYPEFEPLVAEATACPQGRTSGAAGRHSLLSLVSLTVVTTASRLLL
ncbi:DBH-like monooxygenase protein 1 [Pollicipes pollicipes]|uniref:DBH-like monooxygenase protein 1 n=1 Tax=Pollicipes pollicipes TaxID=41117 RepID=UPI00188585B7|nr:DBH-like monooxygenase protein 1 [Pollicipes pollicipes]